MNLPLELLIYTATSGASVYMFWLARHIWKHPDSRLYPNALKHRWSMGIFCIDTLIVNLVTPYLLAGEYAVAAVSLAITSAIMLLKGHRFYDWISVDLRRHKVEARGLLVHSNGCILEDNRRANCASITGSPLLAPRLRMNESRKKVSPHYRPNCSATVANGAE